MKKLTVILIALTIASAAFGCSGVYASERFETTLFEPLSRVDEPAIELDGRQYHTENADYFTDGVGTTAADKFIAGTEAVIEEIKLGLKPKIFLSRQFSADYSYDGAIYLRDPADSMTATHLLLELKFASHGNFGLLFGASAAVNKKCGLKYYKPVSISKLKYYYDKAGSDELDLGFPLFEPLYADKSSIISARSLAVRLTDFVIKEYGAASLRGLLQASTEYSLNFELKYAFFINAFLEANIFTARYKVPDAALRYTPCPAAYRLKISSARSDYYLAGDLKTFDAASQDSLRSYAGIKTRFTQIERETSNVRAFLGGNGHEFIRRITFFIDHRYRDEEGDKNGYVRLSGFSLLPREYARSLLYEAYDPILWMSGMALYCQYRFGAQTARDIAANLIPDVEIDDEYIAGLTGFDKLLIGYYLDTELIEPLDYLEIMAYMYQYNGSFSPEYTNAGLIAYLVKEYGEAAFKTAYADDKGFFYLDGKGEYELKDDFALYLNEKYYRYTL